ncbi:MAG: PAS domain S-box protein [Chryseolinea sp.]
MKSPIPKIKILHLEDSIEDADRVAYLLRKAQIDTDIKVVDTKIMYQDALRTFEPDLVISDHTIPSFSSLEAFDLLKNSKLNIPFILVTGTVSEEFAVEAMRSGADDYLLKDRLQRLPVAITGVLDKFRRNREQQKIEAVLLNIDNNSPDLICTINEKGEFMHLSAAATTMLGYQTSELVGKKYLDFVLAEDISSSTAVNASILRGNAVTMFENRYVRKDGKVIPLLWSARWDDDHKLMYCTAKDATEKKRLEQITKNEQQRLLELFLDAPAAIGLVKGPTHIYEMANPLFMEFTGRTDIIGKTTMEAFPELQPQGLNKLLDKVYRSGKTIQRKRVSLHFDRDGNGKLNEVFWDYVCQPYRNAAGEVEGVFFFAVDVTAQILTQRKIENAKKQYEDLVQDLPVAVYTCDTNGLISLYNKAATELWGRQPEIGKDKWCGSVKMIDQDGNYISHSERKMHASSNNGDSVQGTETFIERPDGTRRNIVAHSSPTFDAAGNPTGAANMLIDITEQKRLQKETLLLIENLQNKNKDLQKFSYIISHNLRAPIAKIMGIANIMGTDSSEDTELIKLIALEAENLDMIVKDINLIVAARKTELVKAETVHFCGKLNQIIQQLEPEISHSHALITSNFSRIKEIKTIKTYLYSILYNLVSNSIKYRRPETPLRIHVRTTREDSFACLSVEDNGRGIDLAKDGSKLFGLYKRFHGDAIPGKGIGLTLVKTQVESLGGRVEVESVVNQGTAFKVYLPINYGTY